MKIKFLFFIFYFFYININAQVLSPDRRVDWSNCGSKVHEPKAIISLLSYGAKGDGITDCSDALQAAMLTLNKRSGIITLPKGQYLFTKQINIPDSVIIRGAHPDSTIILFQLGENVDGFTAVGTVDTKNYTITKGGNKDTDTIYVDHNNELAVGDWIKHYENSAGRIYSSWAENTIGQINKIIAVQSKYIVLEDKMRLRYNLANNFRLVKVHPRRAIGIECMSIIRKDSTAGQTSNIRFQNVVHSWIKGVNSKYCNFGHVTLDGSSHIEVSNSYFTLGYGYGGGGRAYGVVMQQTSGNNLVFNNVFEHLRHSVLIQSGANGNVVSYNYSIDPYWQEAVLPSDAAGDGVCHGNFVFSNLFEGNIFATFNIDNSHGINGPFNTFFRNRAERYGFFVNPSAGEYLNIIGNEVTSSFGQVVPTGANHFVYGNNVRGVIQPNGTQKIDELSLYLKNYPSCYASDDDLKIIGTPNAYNKLDNKAKQRFIKKFKTFCSYCEYFEKQNISFQGSGVICKDRKMDYAATYLPCAKYEWKSSSNNSLIIANDQVMTFSNTVAETLDLSLRVKSLDYNYDCSMSTSRKIEVKDCTSTNEDLGDLFFWNGNNLNSTRLFSGSIKLYNCNGQLLAEDKLVDATEIINVTNFKPGFYFLEIKDHLHSAKKIIKINLLF